VLTCGRALGIQSLVPPVPVPVTPSLRHISYMELEEEPVDPEGDDRVHRHIDVEDEAERARRLQKCEKILSHPVTGVRTVVHLNSSTNLAADNESEAGSPMDNSDLYV